MTLIDRACSISGTRKDCKILGISSYAKLEKQIEKHKVTTEVPIYRLGEISASQPNRVHTRLESELNRMRKGKTREKTRWDCGESPLLFSPRHLFARALLSERLEQAKIAQSRSKSLSHLSVSFLLFLKLSIKFSISRYSAHLELHLIFIVFQITVICLFVTEAAIRPVTFVGV